MLVVMSVKTKFLVGRMFLMGGWLELAELIPTAKIGYQDYCGSIGILRKILNAFSAVSGIFRAGSLIDSPFRRYID